MCIKYELSGTKINLSFNSISLKLSDVPGYKYMHRSNSNETKKTELSTTWN